MIRNVNLFAVAISSNTFCLEKTSSWPGTNSLIMSKEELIDDRVSLNQVKKAVDALHAHELKKQEKFEENQILPSKEQHVWLNITVKTISTNLKLKPHKMYVRVFC